MKTITIEVEEENLHLVSQEFMNLADVDYKLTKIENTRGDFAFVNTGDRVIGPLTIIEVKGGKPGVKVRNRSYCGGDLEMSYIRTSPIVAIIDSSETTITFRTEGGVYQLEKVVSEK